MTMPDQPGWYDDPDDSNAQRYWDGQDWTPHRQRKPASRPARSSVMPTPAQQPPPPPNPTSTPRPPPPLPPPPSPGYGAGVAVQGTPGFATNLSNTQPPGWYPDPNGGPGQVYWDGQRWSSGPPAAPGQAAISPDALRAAMAENRSVWVTNGLAVWSLIAGIVGFLLDFACGVGIGAAGLGVIVGYLAFNKSKKTGQGRGLALSGLIVSGVAFVFGFIVLVVLFGGMGSMGS
jgi:hypothetical protein